jgi:hypothetical protein
MQFRVCARSFEEVRHAFHAFADGDDSIGIIVSSPSRSQLSQRGQEIEAGDAIAILHSDPATVTYLEGLQFVWPCRATRLRRA